MIIISQKLGNVIGKIIPLHSSRVASFECRLYWNAKIIKIPIKSHTRVKKIGSHMVMKYDFFDLSPKSEINRKMSFLSLKNHESKKKKNNTIIPIIIIPMLKIIIAILWILFFVATISSISKIVLIHKFLYFSSISCFFSRSFTSVIILYGSPSQYPIFLSSDSTIASGKISPIPGNSLFIVVMVPVIGSETWFDDSKIFDFPNVKSIFCQIRKKSFICGKYALLPANCVLYKSNITRDIPTGIFAPVRAESVTEKIGTSLSNPNSKNPNFALTGMVTSRKIFVFWKFSSARIFSILLSLREFSLLKIFNKLAFVESVSFFGFDPWEE